MLPLWVNELLENFAACQSSKPPTINHTCHAHLSSFVLRSHRPIREGDCMLTERTIRIWGGVMWSVCCEESQMTKLKRMDTFFSFVCCFFLPLGSCSQLVFTITAHDSSRASIIVCALLHSTRRPRERACKERVA